MAQRSGKTQQLSTSSLRNLFFSKLHNKNPREKDYSDSQTLLDGGLTSKAALSQLNWQQPPATGQDNYQ